MNRTVNAVTFRGRFLGVIVLAAIQFTVGIIHLFFGLAMLSGNVSTASYSMTPTVYSGYTLLYGGFTILFTYFVWTGKRLGWIGTVTVSLFVILADTLTVFDLLNALGIPKVAAIGEIPFSILIIAYLLQHHVRSKYNI